MGKSYAAINFMVLDKTPIEVSSASRQEDFSLCNLNGFANRRGTFSQDVQNSKHYIFNGIDGRFVDFNILD